MPRARSKALRAARLELGRMLTRDDYSRASSAQISHAAHTLLELSLTDAERTELEHWQRLYVAGLVELGEGVTLGAAVKRLRDGRRGYVLRRADELLTAEGGRQWFVLWSGDRQAYPVPLASILKAPDG